MGALSGVAEPSRAGCRAAGSMPLQRQLGSGSRRAREVSWRLWWWSHPCGTASWCTEKLGAAEQVVCVCPGEPPREAPAWEWTLTPLPPLLRLAHHSAMQGWHARTGTPGAVQAGVCMHAALRCSRQPHRSTLGGQVALLGGWTGAGASTQPAGSAACQLRSSYFQAAVTGRVSPLIDNKGVLQQRKCITNSAGWFWRARLRYQAVAARRSGAHSAAGKRLRPGGRARRHALQLWRPLAVQGIASRVAPCAGCLSTPGMRADPHLHGGGGTAAAARQQQRQRTRHTKHIRSGLSI